MISASDFLVLDVASESEGLEGATFHVLRGFGGSDAEEEDSIVSVAVAVSTGNDGVSSVVSLLSVAGDGISVDGD